MIARLSETIKESFLSRTALPALRRSPQLECSPDPRHRFFDIVNELARQNQLAFHVAMEKARHEQPAEFAAAYPSRH